MNAALATAPRTLVRPALLILVLLAACGAFLRAQGTAATSTPTASSGSPSMNRFALLFRQGSRPLSAADLQNRSAETAAWAQIQNAAGHQLAPHILDPESRWIGPDGRSGAAPAGAEGPVTALLFLEARDIEEAVEIARAHPASRYGSSIEVRPWAPPPPRSTAPAPPR